MEAEPPMWSQQPDESMLETMQRKYKETEHPWFLVNALEICYENDCAPPSWLIERLNEALETNARTRPGRGKNSPAEKARQKKIDWVRALAVELLTQRGVSRREVYQAAAQQLADKPEFAGSDTAMKQSYKRAKQEG